MAVRGLAAAFVEIGLPLSACSRRRTVEEVLVKERQGNVVFEGPGGGLGDLGLDDLRHGRGAGRRPRESGAAGGLRGCGNGAQEAERDTLGEFMPDHQRPYLLYRKSKELYIDEE